MSKHHIKPTKSNPKCQKMPTTKISKSPNPYTIESQDKEQTRQKTKNRRKKSKNPPTKTR